MANSKIQYYTAKIPIMDDKLSHKKLDWLDKLTGRDTSIIKRYLEIID